MYYRDGGLYIYTLVKERSIDLMSELQGIYMLLDPSHTNIIIIIIVLLYALATNI